MSLLVAINCVSCMRMRTDPSEMFHVLSLIKRANTDTTTGAYLVLSSSDDSSEEITSTRLAARRVGMGNDNKSVSELLVSSRDDVRHLVFSSVGEVRLSFFAASEV